MKQEVRIHLKSTRYEVEASLFTEKNSGTYSTEGAPEPEVLEIRTLGTLTNNGDRVEITYEESEATGMEGSTTTVTFLKSDPSVITMIREGVVSATLVFENEKRHHCLYQTPFMPFEVCVRTIKVSNSLLGLGALTLDYVVEIRGAKADRTKFSMQILN